MQTVQEGYKTRRSWSNYQDSQGKLISWKSIVKQCIAEENYELRMWEFPRAIAMKTDLPVMARQELPTKMLLERIDLRLPRHGLPDFLGKPQADLLAWHGTPRKRYPPLIFWVQLKQDPQQEGPEHRGQKAERHRHNTSRQQINLATRRDCHQHEPQVLPEF